MTVDARDGRSVVELREELNRLAGELGRPVQFMEVCGTHTVSIFRSGLRSLMPDNVRLISGPGCPVCVTAQRHIDAAIDLASRPDVVVTTYGDMIRVPGRSGSLEQKRAQGGSVRVVYSILDALKLAESEPSREVVFIAVGFETTAPLTAVALQEARRRGIGNFSVLAAHKLVVPAMLALLADEDIAIEGFLCPGHVSVIIGSDAYRPIVERHRAPCVVAGFEAAEMLVGLVGLVRQIVEGRAAVANAYRAVVRPEGNPEALARLDAVFEPGAAVWRAMGEIPASGLDLRPEFHEFDALARFGVALGDDEDPEGCRCGEVIQGKVQPDECALFGLECTPRSPVGPCMVSSEGSCAAWYKYGRPAGAGGGR